MSVDFKIWYQQAKAELEKVQHEKAELERSLEDHETQIAALTRTVNFLAQMLGEPALPAVEPEAQAGMTGSIREILRQAPEPLTASEIRDALESLGFDMKSYSNPLATIHTVLRRLTETDEVETTHELAPGKRYAIPMQFRGIHLGTGKKWQVEKVAGKEFEVGKLKGFIGVGRLKRTRRPKEER